MANPVRVRVPSRVTLGRTEQLASVENQIAGEYRYVIGCDTDTVYTSLSVSTVNSGTMTIQVLTYSDNNYTETETATVSNFPVIAAPIGLLIQKGGAVMSWLEIVVVTTGTTSYKIHVKGVSSADSTVSIAGAGDASSGQSTIPATTPTLIIPVSLTDRSGLIIKNWGPSGSILYIGFSALQATPAAGYPLIYGESMGMDLSGGATLYGYGTEATDVRILQGGS